MLINPTRKPMLFDGNKIWSAATCPRTDIVDPRLCGYLLWKKYGRTGAQSQRKISYTQLELLSKVKILNFS